MIDDTRYYTVTARRCDGIWLRRFTCDNYESAKLVAMKLCEAGGFEYIRTSSLGYQKPNVVDQWIGNPQRKHRDY